MLYRMQIVDFVPSGNWVKPKLIATQDNIEAGPACARANLCR